MGFRVLLAKRGVAFTVEPGETILDAALAHGVTIPYDCCSAYCRTCRTKVLAGSVKHIIEEQDVGLTANEIARGYRLLCSATAESDIELDR